MTHPKLRTKRARTASNYPNTLHCSVLRAFMHIFIGSTAPLGWALTLASDFQFHDHFTDGRTPWTSDQFIARPLPKHRTTQKQNKHIHVPNIHALCGIRTHDPGFRGSEDSTCLRPRGYRNRFFMLNIQPILRFFAKRHNTLRLVTSDRAERRLSIS
jgi:hypothetical protein